MNTKPLVIVLAIVVLLIIGYLVFGGGSSAPSETATTTVTGAPATDAPGAPAVTTTTTTTTAQQGGVTITYGPNGFSPANVTVAPGTKVTWVNNGSGRMWIGSDEHPTHTEFDGTSTSQHCVNGAPANASVFDQCSAGSSYSFTFTKAGTWGYHNHAQSSAHGTVTVR